MRDIDYPYLCTVIGNLAGIPIRIFRNGQQIFYHSVADLPADPLTAFREEVLSVRSHIGYFITPHFHYYGIVNSGAQTIVLGPSIQTKNNDQDLRKLAFQCNVSAEDTPDFIAGMKSILPMPLDSILQILCTVNYFLNDEKLGIGDLPIYEAEQMQLKTQLEQERAASDFDREQSGGSEILHNTLAMEQTIVTFVRRGDTVALREWISKAPAVRPGLMAADPLRQTKNTFLVTATLVSRAAIRGGMDIEDALSLSDAYVQKCELMNHPEPVVQLQLRMVFDYTERVEKLRLGRAPSRFVLDVTNYVYHHLSEPVTTEEIAKALFLSRSRLSVRFKRETGQNLVDFILREKTEEAKRLLRYTDKSAAAISAYLGFSSQSHFSRVFRKYAGCLPLEYRRRHDK